jgi:uncharacterized membrane protein
MTPQPPGARVEGDSPALGLIALTGFDIVIVALTWREYQRQRVYRVVTVSARSA